MNNGVIHGAGGIIRCPFGLFGGPSAPALPCGLRRSFDYYKSVSLFIPLVSVNGTTRIADESPNPKQVTVNGDSKISYARPVGLNCPSILFDGAGDSLTFATNADFDLTGDFTIEFYVHPLTRPSHGAQQFCVMRRANDISVASYVMHLEGVGSQWRHKFAGSTGFVWNVNPTFATGTAEVPVNEWSHIAAVRAGSIISTFVNGIKDQVILVSGPLWSNNTGLAIATSSTANTAGHFNGFLTALRITKGAALYLADFTPSAPPLAAM